MRKVFFSLLFFSLPLFAAKTTRTREFPVTVEFVDSSLMEDPNDYLTPREKMYSAVHDGTLYLPPRGKPESRAVLKFKDEDGDLVESTVLGPGRRPMLAFQKALDMENTPWLLERADGAWVRVLPTRLKVAIQNGRDVRYFVVAKGLELPDPSRKISLRHTQIEMRLDGFEGRIYREPEGFFAAKPGNVYRVSSESNELIEVVVLGFEPVSTAGAPHDLSDYLRGNENENAYLAHVVLKEQFESDTLGQAQIYKLPIGLLGKGPLNAALVRPGSVRQNQALAAFRAYHLEFVSADPVQRWEGLTRGAHLNVPSVIAEVLLRRDCAALLARRG